MPTYTVRRFHDRDEIAEILRPAEPATTVLIDRVVRGRFGRDVDVERIEGPSGSLGGLLVHHRLCVDRWVAGPYLAEPAASQVIGELIDRSPAWGVFGAARHVLPLAPWLRRAAGEPRLSGLFALADPVPSLGPLDERTRLADAADLDALVDLYADYELNAIPTYRRLRRYLRSALERGPAVVAEVDGRIIAAGYMHARTDSWCYWDGLTVIPEARRTGLGWALVNHGLDVSRRMGLSASVVQAGSNPIEFARLDDSAESWAAIALKAPRRFKGQQRLRRWMEKAEGRVRPRPIEFWRGDDTR